MRTLMPCTALLVPLLVLAGCATTAAVEERPMREGEKTFLSPEVAQRLAASEEGRIDIREEPDIRCERFKMTGSHMVHRRCFTMNEEETVGVNARDKMEQVMNRTTRPRSEVGL